MFINLSLKNTKVIIASKVSLLNTAHHTQTFRHSQELPHSHTGRFMSYNFQLFSTVRNTRHASAKKSWGEFSCSLQLFYIPKSLHANYMKVLKGC